MTSKYGMNIVNDVNVGKPTPADFLRIDPAGKMLYNMHKAITKLNLWSTVQQENPERSGYMFSAMNWLNDLGNDEDVDNDGHSGCTFGLTMRRMQYIANNGIDAFFTLFESSDSQI